MKARAKFTAGPEVDKEFFADLAGVFSRYPDVARKYAVRSLTLEVDMLHIDFDKQRAVSQVEGNRIITTFHDRDEKLLANDDRGGPCCEWVEVSGRWRCIFECPM